MKATVTAVSLLALLALGIAACEQKPKPEETPQATTGAAAPAEPVAEPDKAGTPAAEPAAQKVEDSEDIPTTVDFEEQAEQSITASNFEQELTALEKEIASSK
jgi:hypothetical protein